MVLLIDQREWKSEHVVAKCQQAGIPTEERHLPIGDMCWIARCNDIEILLGTIIERKEASDLASSLFGTRYMEQRLRLKNSGMPQILLLVEGNLNAVKNCPAATLEMCMMETRVELGFQIVKTPHLQDTIVTLKAMHRRIVQRTFPLRDLPDYGSPLAALPSAPRKRRRVTSLLEMVFDIEPTRALGMERFMTFDELKAKIDFDRETGTKSSRAIYMAMLKQVATFSHKKCAAIADQYPTMDSLMRAYVNSSDPQAMVRNVPCEEKRVAHTSSVNLCKTFCTLADGTLLTGKKETSTSTSTDKSSNTEALVSRAQSGVTKATLKPPPLPPSSPPQPPPASAQAPSPLCVDLTQTTPVRKTVPTHTSATAAAAAAKQSTIPDPWDSSPEEQPHRNRDKVSSASLPLSDRKPSPKKKPPQPTKPATVTASQAVVATKSKSTALSGLFSDDSSPLFTPKAKKATTDVDSSSSRKAKASLHAQAALRRLGLSPSDSSSSCWTSPMLSQHSKATTEAPVASSFSQQATTPAKPSAKSTVKVAEESTIKAAEGSKKSHPTKSSPSDASSSVWNSPVLSQESASSGASVASTAGQKQQAPAKVAAQPKPASLVFSIDDSSDEDDDDMDAELQRAIDASKTLSYAKTVSLDDDDEEEEEATANKKKPPASRKRAAPPSDIEVIEID